MENRIEYKGLFIRIEQDQNCESPLEHDEGVHVTYKRGSRYILGNDPMDCEEYVSIGKRIESGELIGLPVYAYIHSGVFLRTSSFQGLLPQGHAEFDSGQGGWVYVTKKTALEWYSGKILTKGKRERTLKSLESIVDEFSKYLNGECYGYIVEDKEGNELDDCWGFIGYDYCEQEAKEAADYCIKRIEDDRRDQWRTALHEARERKHWEQRDVVTV